MFPILQSQEGEVTRVRFQLVTCTVKVARAKVTSPQLQECAVLSTTGREGSSPPAPDEAPEVLKRLSGDRSWWGWALGSSPDSSTVCGWHVAKSK